jgi:hypothetical protein
MRALNPRLQAARWFGAVALFTASCHNPSPPAAPAATMSSVAVGGTAPAFGATAQFSAIATFSDGTAQSVTAQAAWVSSDTTVASVSNSGLVSGVAPGGADISATYQNVTGRARVTIVRPVLPTSTISGAVTDGTSGGILPNVDVQATDSAGKTVSTKTGSAGTYTIGGLAAGTVSLTASAVSYRATTLTVALTADERVDIVLPRVTCTFTVSPTSFAFSAIGGGGTVTIASQEKGCTWTAKSNDSFLTIVSGASGLDNGTVSFSAAPNPVGFFDEPVRLARAGTLIIAGAAVTVSQDEPRARGASYDPTIKAPVCEEVGQGCSSVTFSAGPGETNQPNTIFSSCPDGSGGASIDSIVVATLDGSPLAAGKAVKININVRPLPSVSVYIAADALRASWVPVPGNPVSHTNFRVNTVLPAGAGLQAIRAVTGGSIGPGPCATGTNFDNDDLVFRVQ